MGVKPFSSNMSLSSRIPIEKARNLGPVSAAEMEALDVFYLDQIIEVDWEEFCIQYSEMYPHRLNLNAFAAIIGAIENVDWRKIDPVLKQQAKRLISQIKSGRY